MAPHQQNGQETKHDMNTRRDQRKRLKETQHPGTCQGDETKQQSKINDMLHDSSDIGVLIHPKMK
jgi:quinolinate synthase